MSPVTARSGLLGIGVVLVATAALAAVSLATSGPDARATVSDGGQPSADAVRARIADEVLPEQSIVVGEATGTAAPEPLSVALSRNNIFITPVDGATQGTIGADKALAVARESFTRGIPTVSMARLTVAGYHVGDETTALVIEDRLVFVVQLTGLEMAPFGGDASPASMHHELVVFVDATTGDLLLAATVR